MSTNSNSGKELIGILKEVFTQIDWSDRRLPQNLLSRRQIRKVDKELQQLFTNLTIQQYLYDSKQLADIASHLTSFTALAGGAGMPLSKSSELLLLKLVAHEAYGKTALYGTAVQLLLTANQKIALLQFDAKASMVKHWYDVFLLDHAVSRMWKESIVSDKSPYQDPERTTHRTDRELVVERLRESLKNRALKQIPKSLQVDSAARLNNHECLLLLRSAHFFGHCGNDCLRKVQNFDPESKIKVKTVVATLAQQIEDGVRYFSLAIRHRLWAFALSFQEDLSSIHKYDLPMTHEVCFKHKRVLTAALLERFNTQNQALSDIANQYAAMTCLLCHGIALKERYKSAYRGNAINVSEVDRAAEGARYYWEKANAKAALHGETQMRTLTWRRLFEHMGYVANLGFGKSDLWYEGPLEVYQRDILHRFQTLCK